MTRRVVFSVLATALWATSVAFAQSARIVYSRDFPGSDPPYFSVSVAQDGDLVYKESVNDELPVKTKLPEADTAKLFDLAGKLDQFRSPLESGLKVANTGKKILRYESADGKATESVFNYSVNPLVQELVNRLENIQQSERAYINLERTAKYEKLGVNDALAEIESLWLRKELAAPLQFVPLLNRVATHELYMHLARDRAARLRDAFQAAALSPVAKTETSQK